jgi:SnoaL-like protein
MSAKPESSAVAIARAHVQAWAKKDYDTTRSMLASDVHVIAMTTNPALPQTHLTGADAYMAGLVAFADPIVPDSVNELASAGDERNALLLLDLQVAGGPFGAGAQAPCARLYLVEDGKIKTEQVIFYVSQT